MRANLSPEMGTLDVLKGPPEVARVPVCILGNFGCDLSSLLDGVSEHDNSRAFVGVGQTAILIGKLGVTWPHIDGAGNRTGLEFFGKARIDEYRSPVVLQDIGKSVDLGLHGVAERPPNGEAKLISTYVGVTLRFGERSGGSLRFPTIGAIAIKDDRRGGVGISLRDLLDVISI